MKSHIERVKKLAWIQYISVILLLRAGYDTHSDYYINLNTLGHYIIIFLVLHPGYDIYTYCHINKMASGTSHYKSDNALTN